jgi:hypothetical protein
MKMNIIKLTIAFIAIMIAISCAALVPRTGWHCSTWEGGACECRYYSHNGGIAAVVIDCDKVPARIRYRAR